VTATVTAVDDTLDEDEETILVTAEHDGAAVGTQQQIRLTDDDTLSWSVDASPDVIGEADTGSSTVTVSTRDVTFATDQEIELSFDGTAVASDYTVSATTLTLVTGATEVTATVTAVDDTLDEDEETILVTAEHDGGAVGTQQQIRLTDDDTLSWSVDASPDVIGEADTGSSTVTVSTRDVTFATDQEITLVFAPESTATGGRRHARGGVGVDQGGGEPRRQSGGRQGDNHDHGQRLCHGVGECGDRGGRPEHAGRR
jgi:hypothetical protein